MLPENKDKRISTLSIFSNIEGEPKARMEHALELTEILFKAYPYEDSDMVRPIEKPKKVETLKDKDGNEIPF